MRLKDLADEIEAEMRRIGTWSDDPPTEEEVLAGGAFGLGTVAFDQWVQVVFVRRLRQVAEGTFPIPKSSAPGAQATREWDGSPHHDRLLELLLEVDSVVEGDELY